MKQPSMSLRHDSEKEALRTGISVWSTVTGLETFCGVRALIGKPSKSEIVVGVSCTVVGVVKR